MSLFGYFERQVPETRIPKPGGLGVGIRVEGVVLEGRQSVEERLREMVVSPEPAAEGPPKEFRYRNTRPLQR